MEDIKRAASGSGAEPLYTQAFWREAVQLLLEQLAKPQELQFTRDQANQLVKAFGGEDADVTVRQMPQGAVKDDDEPDYVSPAGLYVRFDDVPEEGLIGPLPDVPV